jgi:hypothetical protein
MEIPFWVGIVAVAIVAVVVGTILIRAYVLRQRADQKWQSEVVRDPRVPWGITIHIDPASGRTVDEAVGWCNRAITMLTTLGPWTSAQLESALRGTCVEVHPTDTWIDSWKRNVAGLAWADMEIIEVGANGAALCHELAEILYTVLEPGRPDCWHSRDWWGRSKVETAVAQYIAGTVI